MRRFYAPKENFSVDSVELNLGDTRHLRDVLRLVKGDEVQVFDGGGREFLCLIESIEKKRTALRVVKEIPPTAPESSLDLTFAAAITKGEKFDLVIQKAVELGVTRIAPLHTGRCEVKAGGSLKRLERWRKIALEAAKQTGRARLMPVESPSTFENFLESIEGDFDERQTVVMFSERAGGDFAKVKPAEKMIAIIGPAGGWEESELELALKSGFQVVTLGGRILRAETAAIAFAALLQHKFGDLK